MSPFPFHTMFLMRSLPGNGKSAIAEAILGGSLYRSEGNFGGNLCRRVFCRNGMICSTDFYFYDRVWAQATVSEYIFDGSKIAENHRLNQMAGKFSMENGAAAIVVDNTNTEMWHMEPYIKLAEEYGYKLVLVDIPWVSPEMCAEQNTHGVRLSGIQAMGERWQDFRGVGTYGKKVVE